MNCKFINVLMFAAGAAIGSAVTWKVVKTKYDRIVQEEIESVKQVFAEMYEGAQETAEETEDEDEEQSDDMTSQIDWDELNDLYDEESEDESDDDLNDYARVVNNYTNKKGGPDNMAKEPYVIAPYDFGELDGYHTFELTYYADDILEDDEYNIVPNVDELLGPKALTTFGEYEDDAVFVRNERLRSDFQILRDPRTYSEARSIGPKQVDD